MWDRLQRAASAEFSLYWAIAVFCGDLLLTCAIVKRVPFTNVDWETYMVQVGALSQGEFDYSKLEGPTGPVAYPAGFCWLYGAIRLAGLSLEAVQWLFAAFYLATLALVLATYRAAGAPGWLLALCALSKRVHSAYVLRFFNDGVAQLLLHAALLLLVRGRQTPAALSLSAAVSIKMHPVLYCPAVGMCFVLAGGWLHAARLVSVMVALQVLLAAPFLLANARVYVSRAFGGPGDLQHAWSVNWRALPEPVFMDRRFVLALQACHVAVLAWFAQSRWAPYGLSHKTLWQLRARRDLDPTTLLAVLFACNFVGIAFLRTIHFQYLVWYFHSIPFLAWYALQPDQQRGIWWLLRCAAVVLLTLCVELPFLLTTSGWVRGPDGRTWETPGVPTRSGSVLLQVVHLALLAALAIRGGSGRWPLLGGKAHQ